jgi:hydrogenase assembly chaperone HypC/HupF
MIKTIRLIRPGYQSTEPEGIFCRVDQHGHCSTCSDEALPARVLRILKEEEMAVAEMNGRQTQVDISLVEDVRPGTWILVHGGVALEQLADVEE